MAAVNAVYAAHATLTAAAVDTVTLSGPFARCRITNHSNTITDIIAFRVGSIAANIIAPTAGGVTADDYVLRATVGPTFIEFDIVFFTTSQLVVKLISGQTPPYSVETFPRLG